MREYCLSCCSTADLNEARFKELGITYIPFHFSLGDKEYTDDCGKSVSPAELYRRMLDGEDYPDCKIYVIDSCAASSGYGLLMDKLHELKEGGMGIDELAEWTEENKLRLHHWFFSSDLTFFIKGGRVTKTAGFVGNVLNICPLLNVNFEGKLIPREKIRGTNKAIKRAVELMEEHAENGLDYDGKVYISNSECLEC